MSLNNPPLPVVQGAVWKNADAVLLARIRSIDGTYLQQSTLTSIVLTVYDSDDLTTVVYTVTLTVSSVVYNTLQAYDGILWTIDHTGYNFKYRVAGASAFPGVQDYVVVIMFTLTDGTSFPLKYELSAGAVP
jgi:hypothetical protein